MDALLRLKNEFKNIQKHLNYGCYAKPRGSNWYNWDAQIHHDGNYYQIELKFGTGYPAKPPTVNFVSPVYNPNVYYNGAVCLDLISNNWSSTLTISDILSGLVQLLSYPNPESPANSNAAELFNENREMYTEMVEASNKKNKKYKIVGYGTTALNKVI